MFTGLVEELGKVFQVEPRNEGLGVIVQASLSFLRELSEGASVAINGACQTVECIDKDTFQVFSVQETLRVTNFNCMQKDDFVNLELPLKLSDRLGGHIVQGHVDTVAEISQILKQTKSWDVSIAYKDPGILKKCSIALDGVSLTVHKITKSGFSVQIIPETLKKTNITSWREGKKINIEIDYLVKAVQSASQKFNFCPHFP